MVKRIVLILVVFLVLLLELTSCNKNEHSELNSKAVQTQSVFTMWVYPQNKYPSDTYQFVVYENQKLQVAKGE